MVKNEVNFVWYNPFKIALNQTVNDKDNLRGPILEFLQFLYSSYHPLVSLDELAVQTVSKENPELLLCYAKRRETLLQHPSKIKLPYEKYKDYLDYQVICDEVDIRLRSEKEVSTLNIKVLELDIIISEIQKYRSHQNYTLSKILDISRLNSDILNELETYKTLSDLVKDSSANYSDHVGVLFLPMNCLENGLDIDSRSLSELDFHNSRYQYASYLSLESILNPNWYLTTKQLVLPSVMNKKKLNFSNRLCLSFGLMPTKDIKIQFDQNAKFGINQCVTELWEKSCQNFVVRMGWKSENSIKSKQL